MHPEQARALTLGRKKAERKKSRSVSLLQEGQLRGALGPLPKLRQPLLLPCQHSRTHTPPGSTPGGRGSHPTLCSPPLPSPVESARAHARWGCVCVKLRVRAGARQNGRAGRPRGLHDGGASGRRGRLGRLLLSPSGLGHGSQPDGGGAGLQPCSWARPGR